MRPNATTATNQRAGRNSFGISDIIARPQCDRSTWLRAGFDKKSEEETRRYCEDVFALTLEGQGLVSNRSFWRNIPWVWNDRWSFRNMVLIGNALHTAHFSPHG